MARPLIHVEGQTEEDFVNEALRNHLLSKGYDEVSARIMGNARLRQRRGGIRGWPSVRKDITNHLKQDSECIATTMVDYYALPQQGMGAWPGRAQAMLAKSSKKASGVESALLDDVVSAMGRRFNPDRFIPFVVIHEFEGLLFSDCAAFSAGIGRPDLEPEFRKIRNQFDNPEEINDSPLSAPSKRVEALVPGYDKPLFGTLAVLAIGLAHIREECPHFDGWLKQLEDLVG